MVGGGGRAAFLKPRLAGKPTNPGACAAQHRALVGGGVCFRGACIQFEASQTWLQIPLLPAPSPVVWSKHLRYLATKVGIKRVDLSAELTPPITEARME